MTFDSLEDLLAYMKRDKYAMTDDAWLQDQRGVKANIGEFTVRRDGVYRKITETEFRKVNTYGYPIEKKEKGELKQIAKTAKPATADGAIDISDFNNSVNDYLRKLEKDWNSVFVYSPLMENARIRFDSDSYHHFYYSGRRPRGKDELEARAKCLPFLRDIIEKSGVKGSCSLDEKNHLAFVIMGRANIDGKDTAIKVIIAKKKKEKYYYLSVNNFGEI